VFKIPLEEVKKRIIDSGKLTEEGLADKIKEKLDQLSGLISEEGASHIIANELGVKILEPAENLKIKNLAGGLSNVTISGKVVKKYEVRHFETNERKGKVGSLLLGDETGVVRLVLWNDQADQLEKINEEDILKIESGYLKEQNNRKELHINSKSSLNINPEGIIIEGVQEPQRKVRKTIKELEENDENVELLSTIVQVYDLRFYEVCPTCNKRTREKEGVFECQEHGVIQPNYSYVLNCFLDDGSDNLRCVFFKNQTIQLLGMTDEQIQPFRTNDEFSQVKNDLLGNIIKITGRASQNQVVGRIEFIAQNVVKNPDPKEELQETNDQKKLESEEKIEVEKSSEVQNSPNLETEESQNDSEIQNSPNLETEQVETETSVEEPVIKIDIPETEKSTEQTENNVQEENHLEQSKEKEQVTIAEENLLSLEDIEDI